MELRLPGYGAGNEGFPRSRRTVEKQSLWRLDTQSVEDLPVTQRDFHHLPDGSQLPVQSADILVRHTGVGRFGIVGFVDLELGLLVDDDGSGR